jgi:phosphatidylinositol 4-kinase
MQKFKNVTHSNNQPIYEILSDLYQQGSNPQQIYSQLAEKRINPNLNNTLDRDDLEYFIPQIVTYLVIEKNLEDNLLLQFLINGCTTDFYFAHRVYFYLNSLSANHQNEKINNVCDFISSEFIDKMRIY